MPMHKSPTLTLALVSANRCNALISTGARTALGKAPMFNRGRTSSRVKPQSRMNSLRTGLRSALFLYHGLMYAPPCQIGQVAAEVLSGEQAAHAPFAEAVELFREAEIEVVRQSRWLNPLAEANREKRC